MKLKKNNQNIILLGGAGLVGQNLILKLKENGYQNILVIDKHKKNLKILKDNHLDVKVLCSNLSRKQEWTNIIKLADVVVMMQAQIGGKFLVDFEINNIESTNNVIEILKKNKHVKLIHISSSVVETNSNDFYTITKKKQEEVVLNSGLNCTILRPTLMFGWFDRKHLGWLSRLMNKTPVFPIPGNGKYVRQPLYVGDFCEIIIKCIQSEKYKKTYNISGLERKYYIDILRDIKFITNSKTILLKIPYKIFYYLLYIWQIFDKNPPFTIQQLESLVARDEFEVYDWESEFDVKRTEFKDALILTFKNKKYTNIKMTF